MNQGRIRSLYKFKAVSVRNNWTSATEEQTKDQRDLFRDQFYCSLFHATHIAITRGCNFLLRF